MENEFRELLSNFLFLHEHEVEIIVKNTTIRVFKKGHILLEEGSVSKECYAIIRGCVREFYVKDGLERTTAFFTEGQSVNSFSSYTNEVPSKHFLECSEECLLTVGNQSLVDEMCERIPRLTNFIKSQVEKDAGELQERMANFMTSSPEERFVDLLENRPGLMNRVPQHQIASFLGVTPESLSRIKKRTLQKNNK